MASAPVITFPGIQAIRSVRLVRTHGTSPNVISVQIAPQSGLVAMTGTLRVVWEGFFLVIPDCLVDSASYQYDTRKRVVSLKVLDRRWKWQYGSVSAHYNRRNRAGEIISTTKKTIKEMATELLEAMGEQNYDISAMPNDVFPEQQWQQEPPAYKLSSLCEKLSCRICLGWGNTVKIVRLNEGADLPQGLPLIRLARSVDPAERPKSIDLVTSPVLYQMDLHLEAVGEELDGSIVPIDELSYKPTVNARGATWSRVFAPGFGWNLATAEQRAAANKSVFKWYRVRVPFGFQDTIIPRTKEKQAADEELFIEDVDQVAPINRSMAGTVVQNEILTNKGAILYGRWADGNTFANNVTAATPLPDDITDADDDPQIVAAGWSIDRQKGMVKLSEPLAINNNNRWVEADLYLRCSFGFREKHGGWRVETISREQPQPHAVDEPLVIRRLDLIPVRRLSYRTDSFEDTIIETNNDEIQALADKYIDAVERDLTTDAPAEAEYAGLVAIELDGKIRGVSFNIDCTASQVSTNVQWQQDVPIQGNLSYITMRYHQRTIDAVNQVYLPSDDFQRLIREAKDDD